MLQKEITRDTPRRILGCASQGSGSGDEARLRELLSLFETDFLSFNKARKRDSFLHCLRTLHAGQFDLFVLEGTGMAAGVAAILGKKLWRRPYVVSSGDAVEPFLSSKLPLGKPFFTLYERLLYRSSAGFIGWTPYLVGRALTMGARRAMTAPGWAVQDLSPEDLSALRRSTRQRLGIPEDAIVFGLAGSLTWSKRYQFCYGAELVRAAVRCSSPPYVLIVGDGTGLPYLKQMAGPQLGNKILLPGRVPKAQVMDYLAAMDFGSLPQSVDGVGSFRYTTKLPEYRCARLLVVTNQIPMAYDLDRGDLIRLRGESPWDELFLSDLTTFMDSVTPDQVRAAKALVLPDDLFEREAQVERVTAFLRDLIQREGLGGTAA